MLGVDILIFVTLGTQDKSFERLLDAVQKQIDLGNIKDEVIVQSGYTKFKSKDMKIFDLVNRDKFDEYMSDCSLLITHGGVGSIIGGLNHGKKVIAAARLKKYKEHTNDHQIQIIEAFSNEGYILSLDDFLVNYPKSEKILKDKIKSTSYEILELILLANLKQDKLVEQQLIISKINMLDFYFEESYKKKYISEKTCMRKVQELSNITKMVYGWIKNGSKV